MQGNQGNVRGNIMYTYSWSHASKEVSETHRMYLLTVTCNEINELSCSVHNNAPAKLAEFHTQNPGAPQTINVLLYASLPWQPLFQNTSANADVVP